MAHYALLDENNIVVNVITGRNEDEIVDGISDWETYYSQIHGMACKRTSYNTNANQHKLGGTPFRYNYAQIDGFYDPVKDGFIPFVIYKGWVLDPETLIWVPPTPMPSEEGLAEGETWYWYDPDDEWRVMPPMIQE